MLIELKGFSWLTPICVSSLTSMYSFPQSLYSSGSDLLFIFKFSLMGSQESHNIVLSTNNTPLSFFGLLTLLHFSAQASFF